MTTFFSPGKGGMGGIGQGKVKTQEGGIMKKNSGHTWSGEKAKVPTLERREGGGYE